MLLKSVLMGFLSFHSVDTTMLKECENHADKISGCVEREYHSNGNGKIYWETPFKNGGREGIEKWYYESGELRAEIPYKNGEREGIGKEYYENGNLKREEPYKNNKAEGIEKWYYENGKLMAEMSYLNNLFHGDTRFYTEDGKLLALLKAKNDKIISGKCFDDKVLTDKEREDLSRLKSIEEAIVYLQKICLKESDSNSTLYADTLKECKSDEDKISGCVERYYYKNGNLWIETPYKNGEKDGMVKSYYENGNLKEEIPYKNSKYDGIVKVYYENGKLKIEVPYKNNKREGIAKEYYENGGLQAEIPFKNHNIDGDMKLYTEDGKLLALLKIENYEFISGKCFNDKVLIDKELKEFRRIGNIDEKIIYLQEICLKESDSK